MSIDFARRLLCGRPGSTAEAIDHWLGLHPEAPMAAERLGSGWMIYPGPGVPWGGCSGLGLDGPVSEALFARMEAFFGPLGHEPMVIVSAYADPSLLIGLGARGFTARMFRYAFARRPERLPEPPRPGCASRRGSAAG